MASRQTKLQLFRIKNVSPSIYFTRDGRAHSRNKARTGAIMGPMGAVSRYFLLSLQNDAHAHG